MSATAAPTKINTQLTSSQLAKARRILCRHYKAQIEQRGYTLSVNEVNAEIANIQRRAKAGTMDDIIEALAAEIGII